MLELNGMRTDRRTGPDANRSLPVERPRLDEPLIAVVIPAYKQPGYIQDAVHSVLRQSMRPNIRTVIVNDGCPFQSTDEMGKLFQSMYPGEVLYLRKENGGLSSARNHGVRFALNAWPSVQAVFPLDADNALSPETIEKLWRRLCELSEDTGWTYPDLNFMGTSDAMWQTATSISVYRLAHENLCDAGALVRRSVFESGVWYDENMKRGYEDWEFFLHAALKGFRASHVPEAGFNYRRHGHSMLADARQVHDDIHQFIVEKHADQLRPHQLTELEHHELPRYAVVELDRDRVRWTTNVHSEDQSAMSISEYFDALVEWCVEPRPKSVYGPPITIFSFGAVLEELRRLRVLPGLLLNMQGLVSRKNCAYLNYEHADNPYLMTLNRTASLTDPVMLAVPTRRLIEFGRHGRNRLQLLVRNSGGFNQTGLTLAVGLSHVIHASGPLAHDRSLNDAADPLPNVFDAANDCIGDLSTRLHDAHATTTRRPSYRREVRGAASTTFFAAQQQIDKGLATLPYFAPKHSGRPSGTGIWFAAPWIRLGGVDQVVLNLAKRLGRLCPDYPLHLVVTSEGQVEASPEALSVFDSIKFPLAGEQSGDDEISREEELIRTLEGADFIFNAHSMAAFEALPALRSRSSAPMAGILAVIDPNRFGVPTGFPVLTSRHFAHLLDYFLIPSQRLRRMCINLGVPEDKIHIVPNAPAVHPPTIEAGLELATDKTRRNFSADQPVRILFAGRFDEQKGFDRLGPILESLKQTGVPFDFRVIGKSVMSDDDPEDMLPGATVLPPAQEPAALERYYADADVFVLPSRWEGVPLTVLEAMSFANIVIATNVGAIDETIEHGTNGFLVDPDLSEDNIVQAFSQLIAGIATRSLGVGDLRMKAVRTAMSFTWHDAAERLAALVDPTDVGEGISP